MTALLMQHSKRALITTTLGVHVPWTDQGIFIKTPLSEKCHGTSGITGRSATSGIRIWGRHSVSPEEEGPAGSSHWKEESLFRRALPPHESISICFSRCYPHGIDHDSSAQPDKGLSARVTTPQQLFVNQHHQAKSNCMWRRQF